MFRLLLIASLTLALAACGFQPRGSLATASSLGPVRVVTADPYSPLGQGLSVALARAGATSAAEGEPASVLRVQSEALRTRPLAVDPTAQVREYEIRYSVSFDLVGADGSALMPAQTVELSRDFTYDSGATAGSPAEQALLERELRRDMEAAILRRLDAVLRRN